MSEGKYARRIPVNWRVRKPQHPSASPPSPSPLRSRRRRRTPLPRRSSRPAKTLVLKRCNSEPSLLRGGDDYGSMTPRLHAAEEVLFRPKTCTDLFMSPDYSQHLSPQKCFKGFDKDAKVVVSVTVEGSPGPIRTMVKLGCSVEDTIRHVVRKYNEEGRTPQLDKDATASVFELHHSHFSLQSLNKSDVIGDVGSRSFYLRKSNSRGELESTSLTLDTISVRSNTPLPGSPPLVIVPNSFAGNFNKIIRRTRKLWKFLGCLQCGG